MLIILPMLLTVFHEAGHYYAAKLCGIDSSEFSLGIGPAILRVPATASGCDLTFRLFPFGGRVTYDERYFQLGYGKRALLSAAGWLVDVAVATTVVLVIHVSDATGPVTTIIAVMVASRAALNLLPITSDGRRFLHHLWLLAIGRAA
ncbi:MAG: site-2 protease family protein [Roseateles sp.]|uniref:site-2 protease family protein n=1 Tax=Roseateles sp. TaxID=1971397 RepID=UPI00403537AA